MNPLHRSASRSGLTRRRVTAPLLPSAALAALALSSGGCSSADATKVKSAANAVYQDAASAAGQRFLADMTRSALDIGLDIATGNDLGAAVAGIQGAASAVRDYEGLTVAPSSVAIARAAAAGSGVTTVAAALVPGVQSLVESARQSAVQQKLDIRTDDIIEALARGFDAVADAGYVPPASH